MLTEGEGDSPALEEVHSIECAKTILDVHTVMSEQVADEIGDAACSKALKKTKEYKCVKLATKP